MSNVLLEIPARVATGTGYLPPDGAPSITLTDAVRTAGCPQPEDTQPGRNRPWLMVSDIVLLGEEVEAP